MSETKTPQTPAAKPPAAAAPGGELATRSFASTDLEHLQTLKDILLTGELNVEVIDDPGEISRGIVAQLLAAGSDEELENFGNAEGWREFMGVPFELHGFRWLPSDYAGEGGSAIYFVVQATNLESGERQTLTTGSMNVLAQLTNMAERGTLVGAVRMLTKAERDTKGGFRPYWLVTPEKVKAETAAAKAAAATDAA